MTSLRGSDFDGLVALVTGGANGIGAATATLLLTRGARVAVLDRDPAGAPSGTLALSCDITDAAAVEKAVVAVVDEFGSLDVVVNNAGIGAVGDVTANDDSDWARVLDVNVIGTARVTRAALPHLRRSRHAVVVNTCSAVAHVGVRQRALYSASKGAIAALTLAMAADHVSDGVRVNAVSPGTADTAWVEPPPRAGRRPGRGCRGPPRPAALGPARQRRGGGVRDRLPRQPAGRGDDRHDTAG